MKIEDLSLVRREARIQAPIDEVRRAIQEPDALRQWLAEDAELIGSPPRRIRLAGPDVMPSAAIPDEPLLANEASRIEFPYRARHRAGSFEFAVEDRSGETWATATVRLPGNTESHPWWVAYDATLIALHNLREFAERGRRAFRPDYGQASRGECRVSIEIEAAPEDVWPAVAGDEPMRQIFGEGARSSNEVGGEHTFGWNDGGPRKILEIERPSKLVTDWHYLNEPETRVTWLLEGRAGSTTLTIQHEGFGDMHMVEEYIQGWGGFLVQIKSLVERGTPALD